MQIGIANGIPLNHVVSEDDLIPVYDQSTGTEGYVNINALSTVVTREIGTFSWNSATSSPAGIASTEFIQGAVSIHRRMRRCVVNDAGVVQYYLSATDSTKKADGSAAVITGADGQVMVEIPKFYTRRSKAGTVTTWSISATPLDGFAVHPAFVKDGVEVSFRYIGAYDACVYDASAATYISGTNLDDNTANIDAANDTVASVSGVYPMVGLTRAQFRTLAANRGSGWRLADFWLIQAVQMLYLVEHQTFYSQSVLGAGNTNGSYGAPSAVQADSPHTVAGASNAWGNTSTNGTQPSASAKPGTAYMSYRGIENLFGNCWSWVDGFNINNNRAYVSNTTAHFADDAASNYSSLGTPMVASDGYPTNNLDVDNAWLPASVGGSTTTYWTDYYYQAGGWRVAGFGGSAYSGANAGAFCWSLSDGSGIRARGVGSRLAR